MRQELTDISIIRPDCSIFQFANLLHLAWRVIFTPSTPLAVSIPLVGTSGVHISSEAGFGSTYTWQASTNLFDWDNLTTIEQLTRKAKLR